MIDRTERGAWGGSFGGWKGYCTVIEKEGKNRKREKGRGNASKQEMIGRKL